MIERNVKTNLSALQVFHGLKSKIAKNMCKFNYSYRNAIGLKCLELCKDIKVYLSEKDKVLTIITCPTIKAYRQELTDYEYADVKKGMIEMFQAAQDKFEKWVTE